jgi:hypothetical protein
MFDVNLSMAGVTAETDYIQYAADRDTVFASLLDNEEFYKALKSKLISLAENNFNPERVSEFIDDYERLMAAPMEKEYKRFYGENKSIDDFYTGCEDIRRFFERRYDYIMETYGNDHDAEQEG